MGHGESQRKNPDIRMSEFYIKYRANYLNIAGGILGESNPIDGPRSYINSYDGIKARRSSKLRMVTMSNLRYF